MLILKLIYSHVTHMKISESAPVKLKGRGFRFAIILSRFNDKLGLELLKNTKETLIMHEVKEKHIKIFRVPGALEIPISASLLAQKHRYNVIIALGVVIKGETPHFQNVSEQCYRGLMDVSLYSDTPVIFGVLTVNNEKQAKERVAKRGLDKGKEYAEAAIEMAMLLN